MRDRRLKSDFLGLSREDRFDLMDKCSECFKRAISEIPEYCCEICSDEMDEERYRRFGGICFRCNERMSSGDLYFEKVFTIGQERGNLAYAIKAFKSTNGRPSLPSRSFHYMPDNFTLIDLNFCTCPYQYGLVWILVEEVKKIIDLWLRKRI